MANMVTIPEAAEALGCTRQNIYQLIDTHKIPTSRKSVFKRYVIKRAMSVKHVDLDLLERIQKGA